MMKQPHDETITANVDGGKVSISIKWNPNFADKINDKIHEAQFYVDTEFLSHSMEYIPRLTGNFANRTQMYNIPLAGTGMVVYPGPSARYLWHGMLYVDPDTGKGAFFSEDYGYWSRPGVKKVETNIPLNFNGAPMRGPYWALRMWADHKDEIIDGTQQIMNGEKTIR